MTGLMGGTFSPIHYGHLLMCETIREEFNIDRIIFMPAKTPPHKNASEIADARDRLEIVKLAISGNPYFEVSDLEMKRKGSSYTVDTLTALRESNETEEKTALIMGADSLVQIKTWKSFREIFAMSVIIVATRPDTDEKQLDDFIAELTSDYHAEILKSSNKPMDFSSTEIRKRVSNEQSIRYMVPVAVEEYIYDKGLYR